MKNKKQVVLFDFDGTITDTSERVGKYLDEYGTISKENKELWERFHQESLEDPANNDVIEILEHVKLENKLVFIVTAREEKYRDITNQWLALNNVQVDKILMRAEGDESEDYIYKRNELHKLQKQGYEICFAFDDRESICNMYKQENVIFYKVFNKYAF